MQQKISKLMEKHHISFGELAEKLNISKQTLTRKVNGSTDWTYQEITTLTQLLSIKDPQDFFFSIK
ncbi:helix-turn-helix domain-containing protein [Cellulosilyticum sp. I15G10I2]|uniref:helix-turn-helix domain-containing protein n=1 Tax=Cellulosilyticum sp. I15G10I2 TaxID=1892843 RepID=UPI00085C6097|nr:helix-turn-helix transcriptional regulator [Cellulosilyticum sp. I15G10I2]